MIRFAVMWLWGALLCAVAGWLRARLADGALVPDPLWGVAVALAFGAYAGEALMFICLFTLAADTATAKVLGPHTASLAVLCALAERLRFRLNVDHAPMLFALGFAFEAASRLLSFWLLAGPAGVSWDPGMWRQTLWAGVISGVVTPAVFFVTRFLLSAASPQERRNDQFAAEGIMTIKRKRKPGRSRTLMLLAVLLAAGVLFAGLARDARAAATFNYPNTTPNRSVMLQFGSYYGDGGANKIVIGLDGTWCDEERIHRVGAHVAAAFGAADSAASQSFFFHDAAADYYYTFFRTGVLDQEGQLELRAGLMSGVSTLRWDEFAADVVTLRPGLAGDFYWHPFFASLYVGAQYSFLLTDWARAWGAWTYGHTPDANSDDNKLIEILTGATLGVYLYNDEFGLMVEPAARFAVYPVTGTYAFITPGIFYNTGNILFGAGYEIGLTTLARDSEGDFPLRFYASLSF